MNCQLSLHILILMIASDDLSLRLIGKRGCSHILPKYFNSPNTCLLVGDCRYRQAPQTNSIKTMSSLSPLCKPATLNSGNKVEKSNQKKLSLRCGCKNDIANRLMIQCFCCGEVFCVHLNSPSTEGCFSRHKSVHIDNFARGGKVVQTGEVYCVGCGDIVYRSLLEEEGRGRC